MKKKLRVGVIFGGRSGEHEISLLSARSIMAAMDPAKYEIVPIGITHDGRWLLSGDPMAVLSSANGQGAGAAEGTTIVGVQPARCELVPGATSSSLPPLDVVFPVLHGPYGEDGTVQGLLELAGLPYVGSGVLASSLGMDKVASKTVFRAHGLPVVAFWPVKRRHWEAEPGRVIADVEAHLRYPLFVKPANLGSSIGVSKVHNRAQLRVALDEAARYDRKLLVEEAVPNAREIECSVLGNDDPEASVPGEIVPSNEFYDYAAKYLDGRSALLIPAPLSKEKAAQVRTLSVWAFQALDAAGLARVDFLMDGVSGALYLSEVNTMPGFTAISMYPKLWEASGIPYPELVDRLIELALERHADKSRILNRYNGAQRG
ncbi:MAG: D-alanine--D-alanine ligase family protein [Anaerolineae bacterium]